MADAGEIRIDISEFIIDEVLRTLRDKFEWSAERLQEAADQMTAIARKVAPSRTVDVLKEDPADNRILECAAQAKSDYLVTGDTGLLRLGSFEDIPIVKVADFLEIVCASGKRPRTVDASAQTESRLRRADVVVAGRHTARRRCLAI